MLKNIIDALVGLDGIHAIRVTRDRHGTRIFYIVTSTHDVTRDYQITARLWPLGVEHVRVPLKAIEMIPAGITATYE